MSALQNHEEMDLIDIPEAAQEGDEQVEAQAELTVRQIIANVRAALLDQAHEAELELAAKTEAEEDTETTVILAREDKKEDLNEAATPTFDIAA